MSVHAISRAIVRLWEPRDSSALSGISNWAAANTIAHFRCPGETASQWEERLDVRSDRHPCLVAECDGLPVGYAAGHSFSGGCGFSGVAEVCVYIHHQHTGGGLGTQLYERLIPALTGQGYRCLLALIASPNPASERLHQRFGFRRVGVVERVGWKLGRSHDVGYWQRDLVAPDSAPTAIRSAREAFLEWKASEGD